MQPTEPSTNEWSQSIISIKALNWDSGLEYDDAYRAMVKYQTSGGMRFAVDGLEGPYVLRILLDNDSCALRISRHDHLDQSITVPFDAALLTKLNRYYELQQEYSGLSHSAAEDEIGNARERNRENEREGCDLIRKAFADHGVSTENNAAQPLFRLMNEVLWKQKQRGPVQRDINAITYKGFHSERYLGTHDEYVERIQDASRVHIAAFQRPYEVTIINQPEQIVLQFHGQGKTEQCKVALPKEYWLNILGKRQELVNEYNAMVRHGTDAQIKHADDVRHEHHNASAALLRYCLNHEGIEAPQGTRKNDVCRNIIGIVTELLEGETQLGAHMKPIVGHFGETITLPQSVKALRDTSKPGESKKKVELDVPVVDPIYAIGTPVTVSAYASPQCTVYQFIGSGGDFRITMPEEFNELLYRNGIYSPEHEALIDDTLSQAGVTADKATLEQMYALADKVKVKQAPGTQVASASIPGPIIPGTTARYCA